MIFKNWDNEQWNNYEKYTKTIDLNGYKVSETYEFWENNVWKVEYKYFYNHVYDNNNNVSETTVQYWSPDMTTNLNITRHLFSDFQHFQTSSLSIESDENIQIYPNPSRHLINISIENYENDMCQVDIFNILGKKVLNTSFSGSSLLVNIEMLESGLYIVSISNNKGVNHTLPFIKE